VLLTVTEQDNDQELLVWPTFQYVSEGETYYIEVALSRPPTEAAQVTTTWLSGDADISVASGGVLTFDATNFDVAQQVWLAAAQDADLLNGTARLRVSSQGAPDVLVTVTEADDDRPPLGDLNCDWSIDFFDIDPFLLALFEPATYPLVYPACDITLADVNEDGFIDYFDVDPFLGVLFNG
jgi:hypothetical protein